MSVQKQFDRRLQDVAFFVYHETKYPVDKFVVKTPSASSKPKTGSHLPVNIRELKQRRF